MNRTKSADVWGKRRATYGTDAIALGPRSAMSGRFPEAKIAFGRVPNPADFDDIPLSNYYTQFCSV